MDQTRESSMCLEPHFLGVAPRGSRCKHFAMLKSRFKEAFRHNYEISQYGNEPLSSHKQHWNFCDSLVRSAVGSGSRLPVLRATLSLNCHTVTEMQQRGCCFAKGEMLVLHWAPPFVPSWVGRDEVRADHTSATAEMCAQSVWSQPPVITTLKLKEMPYSAFSEKWDAQQCCFQGCRGLQIVKMTFTCLFCN